MGTRKRLTRDKVRTGLLPPYKLRWSAPCEGCGKPVCPRCGAHLCPYCLKHLLIWVYPELIGMTESDLATRGLSGSSSPCETNCPGVTADAVAVIVAAEERNSDG